MSLTLRVKNKLRGDVIRLGGFYVCNDTHDEILETIFQGKNYIEMNCFWMGKLKLLILRVNITKIYFHIT